jgi:hypothetical protein
MTSFEVLNCSSESDEFPALNLQTGQGAWQTDGYVREATIDIGFDTATSFDKVELGNLGCAFIELLVAKDTDSDEYEALVAPVALQSYSESKSNTNRTKSFVFTMKDKLKAKVAQQSWHKLRIICKQTFNTALPIGLNFVRINSTSKSAPVVPAAASAKTSTTATATSASNNNNNNNNKLQGDKKSSSRLVFEDRSDEQDEESAAALFAKIKPATTFAQLKAQVEQEKSKTPVKKTPVTAPVTKNSAAVARDNPFGETKPAGKSAAINSKSDSTKSGKAINSTASQSATKTTAATQNNKSALPNKDKMTANKTKDSKADDKKKSVPLNKVMADVTIVISGIQNPERHKLRTLVKEMGGSYRPDWDDQATHLIAVFPNAPKVLQAAEDGATIVTKDWIYDSHKRAARQSVQPYLLGNKKKQTHATKDSDEEDDSGPNEYDYDDGFLVADDTMDDDYDPSLKSKPKKKPKNKAVMLADDDLDTINEAEQWLSSAKSQPKHGVKRKQEDEEEDEELLHLNKKVKLDKSAAKSAANQLAHDESDSGEGTEGMAEDDIAAQVQQMKHGKVNGDKSNNNNKSAAKSTSHKPNTVVQQDDDDELTDEMREDEIRTHLKRASSQLSQSRDSQGTQELAEDELLY